MEQTGQLAAELAHVHDDAGVHVKVDRASALPVNNPIQTKCICLFVFKSVCMCFGFSVSLCVCVLKICFICGFIFLPPLFYGKLVRV